jgi:hypothetical protein
MKRLKCPKCFSQEYRTLKKFSYCRTCEYNSLEGYPSGSDGTPGRPFAGTRFDPLWDRIRMMAKKKPKNFFLSDRDYPIVCGAILKLPLTEQRVLYLKFWKKLDSLTIGYLLGLSLPAVETYLSHAYRQLKTLCLSNPEFVQDGPRPRAHLSAA